MTDEVRTRLFDALRVGEAIQEFVDEQDFQKYERDLMLRSAVERQLEIIGEACGQAVEEDEPIEERIPALLRIVALRNRVLHGYDSVDDEIVWDIVQSKVSPLVEDLRGFLEEGLSAD
jgi:uncharacterized protein with HEPN domain